MINGKVTLTIAEKSLNKTGVFKKRLVHLHQNPLIKPLPKAKADTVATHVADIPQVLSEIKTSWDDGQSFNNIAAW